MSFTTIFILPMPLDKNIAKHKIILASQSPRRHELLAGLDIEFEVRLKDVEESFSPDLKRAEIPEYLAKKKASVLLDSLAPGEVLITSDTVVCLGDKVFNKPQSHDEAVAMITEMAGSTHDVITGVCLSSVEKQEVFHEVSSVTFGELDADEIEHYVSKYKPFDKAGAYGIQEWIGYAGIDKIEGSFYNVMGLPTRKLYKKLKSF